MSTPRQPPGAMPPPANAPPAGVDQDADAHAQGTAPEPVEPFSPPCALHEVDEQYRGF